MFSTLEPDLDNASVGTYRLIDVILPLGVVRAVLFITASRAAKAPDCTALLHIPPANPFNLNILSEKENES